MKPNSTADRNFPLIEWYYRSEPKTGTSAGPIPKLPPLYRLTVNFFAAEVARDYFAELTAFALISAISAWPIFFSLVSIVRMVRGY